MSDSAIYKFYWDCGRMGDVSSVFAASKSRVAEVMGKTIYFGEILGKHSEIYGPLDPIDITLVTDDPVVVDLFIEHKLECGYNPLRYVQEENQ